MRKSKTIALLKSLDKKELKQLTQLIRSPFFLQSKDALALFDYIIKYAPAYDADKLEKEYIFKRLFKGETYSDIKLRNLMRKLTKVLEEFLLLLDLRKDELKKRRQLTKIYGERDLYPYFERETFQIIEQQKKLSPQNNQYLWEEYHLLKNWYFHPHTHNNAADLPYLKQATLAMSHYSKIELLKLKIEFLNRARLFNEDKEIWPQTIQLSKEDRTIQILDLTLKLIEEQKVQTYVKLKQHFLDTHDQIEQESAQTTYFILINFTIQQSRKEEMKYLKETFELYKIGINAFNLFPEKKIDGGTFLNIVVLGSRLKEFNWIIDFIKEYQNILQVDNKEQILNLSRAFLAFHRSNFTHTIKLLSKTNTKENLLSINEKSLLIRTYFELILKGEEYFSVILSAIETFEKLIKRRKFIHPSKQIAYLNFTNYIRKLTKCINSKNHKKLNKVIYDLKEEQLIISKAWLLEKIKGKGSLPHL